MTHGTIRIAAALLRRSDGRILLVRKHGTSAYMQPGGKIEPGEWLPDALCRELSEELSLTISPSLPRYLGLFHAPAANEPGWTIAATLFLVDTDAPAVAASEIGEAIWIDPNDAGGICLAPLTRDHVLPLCRRLSL